MVDWAVGQLITAARLNDKVFKVLAYGSRTTNGTTTTTTEQPYLRLDNIPIVNGEHYAIEISPLIYESSVAGDLITVNLRASTSGNATISSTLLTVLADDSKTASGNQKTKGLNFPYLATVTGNLSLLISYVRSGGTGNVRINAQAGIPATITVKRRGTAVANTAVSL